MQFIYKGSKSYSSLSLKGGEHLLSARPKTITQFNILLFELSLTQFSLANQNAYRVLT